MMCQVVPCCYDAEQQRFRRQHEGVEIYEIVALQELCCVSFELDIFHLTSQCGTHSISQALPLPRGNLNLQELLVGFSRYLSKELVILLVTFEMGPKHLFLLSFCGLYVAWPWACVKMA